MRLIDADALVFDLQGGEAVSAEAIHAAPTADAAPARRGVWLNRVSGFFEMGVCSQCGESCCRIVGRYCPNCGARMDGGDAQC